VPVTPRLAGKARIATAIAVVLLLASPVLALRNCIEMVKDEGQPVASDRSADDRLILLKNGSTMLLQSTPLAKKVSEWLELEPNAKAAFEIADENFALGSADLSADGRRHVEQVGQILTADPRLRAQISAIATTEENTIEQLERLRASRLQSELIAQHVAPANLVTTTQPSAALSAYHVIGEPGRQSQLFIIVSR